MDKSAGVPKDMPYEGHQGDPAFQHYNQPPQGIGAPPAYAENTPHSETGHVPPGQAYPPPGQMYPQGPGYPPSGLVYPPQGYAPQGQGYAPHGQGYAPHGQGYPPQGQGYAQQQYHQANVIVAQPLMYQQAVSGPPPPDHMCAAIFVTLCCFWPTGIVAIMRASDARSALARGDISGAHAHATSAKSMVTISIIVGIIAFVVVAIIIGVYVGVVVNSFNRYD